METKKIKCENRKQVKEEIVKLQKDNFTFFVNNYDIIVLISGVFIEFYLFVFQSICRHFCDDVTSCNDTDFHFYVSNKLRKSFNHFEIDVFSKYLGHNFDSYDFTYTDDIFVIY